MADDNESSRGVNRGAEMSESKQPLEGSLERAVIRRVIWSVGVVVLIAVGAFLAIGFSTMLPSLQGVAATFSTTVTAAETDSWFSR